MIKRLKGWVLRTQGLVLDPFPFHASVCYVFSMLLLLMFAFLEELVVRRSGP